MFNIGSRCHHLNNPIINFAPRVVHPGEIVGVGVAFGGVEADHCHDSIF